MPRIDDYRQACRLARDALAEKDPDPVARFAGADVQRDSEGRATLCLRYLNQVVDIPWPGFECSFRGSSEEVPVQQQVLILHYLLGAWSSGGAPVTGEWIAFQEIPDGRFYLDAFQKRAKNPLVQAFGNALERLLDLGTLIFEATVFEQGDVSVLVKAFPLVPIVLILWKGDEEFPPEGNLLFDRNISKILSAEDVAWLAGMVVYPLVGQVRGKGKG